MAERAGMKDAYEVSTRVNTPKNNEASLITPVKKLEIDPLPPTEQEPLLYRTRCLRFCSQPPQTFELGIIIAIADRAKSAHRPQLLESASSISATLMLSTGLSPAIGDNALARLARCNRTA